MQPYNAALHAHMVALEYTHERVDAEVSDHGSPESGPMECHYPAYDQYTGPDEIVFCTERGLLDRTARDLEFEAWVDQQTNA